jgi:hypothetical protein
LLHARARRCCNGATTTAAVKGLTALPVCALDAGGYRGRIAARECGSRSYIGFSELNVVAQDSMPVAPCNLSFRNA